ncbi:UTRA domain-containing protein [Streptosporangium canum]|uniref:UTRA domain-containing protein n=1 Tax=Streptosporangium canum TaxID=324952 RepID=UPI0033B0E4FF
MTVRADGRRRAVRQYQPVGHHLRGDLLVAAYYDDRGVVALSTSWLPGELAEAAPELLVAEPLPKMTFGLVEDRTGRRAVRRRDTVAVKPVSEDVSPVLGVESGRPTLTMTNHYWDQRGDVTEYAVDFLGPGRELSADYALE